MLIEGEPLKITCFSYTKPVWTYDEWTNGFYTYNKSVKLKDVYGISIYAPNAIPNGHMGTYYCKGTRQSGEKFIAKSYLYVGCKYYIIS